MPINDWCDRPNLYLALIYLPTHLPTYLPTHLPTFLCIYVCMNFKPPLPTFSSVDWLTEAFLRNRNKDPRRLKHLFPFSRGCVGLGGGVLQGVGNRADLGRLGAMMKFMGGKRAFITFANIVRSYMCPTLQLQVITDSNQCTKDETASCN